MAIDRRKFLAGTTAAAALGVSTRAPAQAKPRVTFISQWSAGSDGAAISGLGKRLEEEGGVWQPALVEFGFGFSAGGGRDPASIADPVTLDGGWQLHGVVDLVEGRTDARYPDLRVTDHKTGRPRAKAGFVVGEGQVLQPIHGLALNALCVRDEAE